MTKFHINSKGDPGKCSAKNGGCPFGSESDHYNTPEQARQEFERANSESQLSAHSKKDFNTLEQINSPIPKAEFIKFNEAFILESTNDSERYGDDWTNYSDSSTFKPKPNAAKALRKIAGLPEGSKAMVRVTTYSYGSGDGYALDEASESLDVYVGNKKIIELEGEDSSNRILNRINYAEYDPKEQADVISNLGGAGKYRFKDSEVLFDDGSKELITIESGFKDIEEISKNSRNQKRVPVYVHLEEWAVEQNKRESEQDHDPLTGLPLKRE
jgi:hypothetical protein